MFAHDKMLEVVCVFGAWHLGKLQVGLSQARRLAQGKTIKIHLSSPFPVQKDAAFYTTAPMFRNITSWTGCSKISCYVNVIVYLGGFFKSTMQGSSYKRLNYFITLLTSTYIY